MVSRDTSLVRRPTRAVAIEERSPHNRALAFIFAFFFGMWGLHRFYTGRFWTGALWFLTGGLFFFGWFYDLIILAMGRFRDGEGRVLGPPQYERRPMIASERQGEQNDEFMHRMRERERAPREARQNAIRQHQQKPREEEDPYLEEAMVDPLKEKFDALEDELRANKGRDGSVG